MIACFDFDGNEQWTFDIVATYGKIGTFFGYGSSPLLFENSISWLKGSHSITAGGNLTQFQITSYSSSLVPEIDFEVLYRTSRDDVYAYVAGMLRDLDCRQPHAA